MTIAWVLGSSGLLGTALCRMLRRNGTDVFSPAKRFCWTDSQALSSQITAAVGTFASQVGPTDRWEIYWAAGIGTMSSTTEAISPETRALSLLLELIGASPQLMASTGAIAFASSAGAIYAGAADDIITENSTPAPTTDYAREKLRQEDCVRRFVEENCRASALIARISTLFGPGQATEKKQGLMTHIARSILRNQPIQIYVPYDTIRDYISADDAAAAMISALRHTGDEPKVITKIIASEHPVTIAEIISIFKRVARRNPRIVTSANRMSALYSRRVQFRSVVLSESSEAPSSKLAIGISRLMAAERASFARNASHINLVSN